MPQVPEGKYEKSFYYNEPLVSEAISSDIAISLAQGAKLAGFRLLSVEHTEGYTLKLSAGSFISNGIAVEIKSSTELEIPEVHSHFTETLQPGILIYGYTVNSIKTSPVTIDFKFAKPGETVGLNPTEALLGIFYPKTNSIDTYFSTKDGRDEDKTWKWLPAPSGKIDSFTHPGKDLHAHFEELGTQWTKTTILTGDTDTDLEFDIRGVLYGLDWAYRIDIGHPTDDDQNHLFFCNGKLLREGADYSRISPGSLMVWGKAKAEGTYLTNPYFSSSNGIEATELTSGSFSSLLSENIKWKYETAFNGLESNVIDLPANYQDGMRTGTRDYLIFTNGFLLPPTRYNLDRNNGQIEIKPRTEFETGSDNTYKSWWLPEDRYYDTGLGTTGTNDLTSESVMNHITVVGVDNLTGIDTIYGDTEYPVTRSFEELNASRATHSSTKFLGHVNSNDMQVWANGRLTYPDHMWANTSTVSFAIFPSTEATVNDRQAWVREKGTDKVEMGPLPIDVRRDTEYASYYGITDTFFKEKFNSLVGVRFGSSGKQKEIMHTLVKPFSFEELEGTTSSVGRALFNHVYRGSSLLTSGYSANSDQTGEASDPRQDNVDEFFNNGGFNNNYFVTYDYLMGFTSDPNYPSLGYIMPGYTIDSPKWPVKDNSILGTSVRIEMFSDVPMGTGPALQAAIQIANGGELAGLDPIGNRGQSLVSSTGLYDKENPIEEFFSDLNPIVNMGSLDAFISKFSETFGFYTERGDGTRDILRNAGTEYDLEFTLGAILKSFGAQLSANSQRIFDISDTASVVEVIDKLAGIQLDTVGYGWGMGYMWSNAFFNMEDGTFSEVPWEDGRHLGYTDEHWGHRWQHGDNRGWFSTQHTGTGGGVNLGKYSNTYFDQTKEKYAPHGSTPNSTDIQLGMYFGNKGFLRPDTQPIHKTANEFWKSDIWKTNSTYLHADKATGSILIPSGDLSDKCYPVNTPGRLKFKYRDGYNTDLNNTTDTCGVGSGGKLRNLYYRLGDRTYVSKKGSIHNFNIHVNPIQQLYSFIGSGVDDVANNWLDNSTTRFWVSDQEAARRWTYYLEYQDDKFGLRPYAHSMSQDIKGYERGTSGGYQNQGNYWGMANVLLQFFIFGPLASVAPTYVGSENLTENFFFKQ